MNIPAVAARYKRVTPDRIHIVLPLLYMAGLYWLSSLPGTAEPGNPVIYILFYWPPIVQNALHIPAYAILTLVLRWALRAWMHSPNTAALGACAIASAYAVFDEWHQGFVPGRHSSLADVMLDLAGVALGIWLAAWLGSRAQAIASGMNRDKIKPEM
jgi:VanZ like family